LQSSSTIKKISLAVLVIFYIAAGINHFRNPAAYFTIIPSYFPKHELINILSGVAEILFAVLLLFSKTKKIAAYGIILMLIAFIPAHIYMIEKGWCMSNGFCLPLWARWIRLFPLQFLLIWWACWHRK
jgi:uncharacterized membrane protein